MTGCFPVVSSLWQSPAEPPPDPCLRGWGNPVGPASAGGARRRAVEAAVSLPDRLLTSVPTRSATRTRNLRERARASVTQKQKLPRPERGAARGSGRGAGQGRPPTPSTPQEAARGHRCQGTVSLRPLQPGPLGLCPPA